MKSNKKFYFRSTRVVPKVMLPILLCCHMATDVNIEHKQPKNLLFCKYNAISKLLKFFAGTGNLVYNIIPN